MSKSNFDILTPEEKVRVSIDCVARGVPIPDVLRSFLKQEGLLEAIEAPAKTR